MNRLYSGIFTFFSFITLWGMTTLAVFADGTQATRMVTDPLGRSMVTPVSPRRVVSLAPSITEIVYTIGQQDRLVGVSQFSDHPPEARALPKVGSYVRIDLEKIVALQPDLCIAVKDGNPKEVVDRLTSFQIPVYVVNPRNIEAVFESTLQIGRLLNAEQRSETLVQQLRTRVEAVDNALGAIRRRPRVFIQIGISPIVSAGTDTFINELIERAGGINVSRGVAAYPRFSREQVLSLAPDVIIITSMEQGALFEKEKEEWSQWQELPAARNNRIHIETKDLFNRPTPRLVDGLELMARFIHPVVFGEGS